MIGCEDGVFPHMRAIESGDLEEERRLCYVGITRAKRELYMTHARVRALYGAREWNVPSRFLAEIPEELVDREVQEPQSFRPSWNERQRPAPDPTRERRQPRGGGATFSLGDDVVHASLGDGVVVGVEPGVAVVRFASDGSERKLMVDYAPLKRR
jgi:DNA helicase-2/ATP-dependent DNA helicase PcrA